MKYASFFYLKDDKSHVCIFLHNFECFCLPVSLWFLSLFLTLGIKENGESNCKNSELVYQVENAIPEGYTKSIFCAGNSVDVDATCRGDSGKYVLC